MILRMILMMIFIILDNEYTDVKWWCHLCEEIGTVSKSIVLPVEIADAGPISCLKTFSDNFVGHSFISNDDMNHNSDGSNLPIIRALLCLDSQPNGFPTVLFRLAHLEKFSCYQIEHLWILILSVKKDYVDCVVITCHHHDHNLIVILRDVDDLQVLLLVARHHQGATQAAAMLIGIPGSLKS